MIDLITRFWEDSIDRLSPEKGVVDGPKPVFFAGWDEDAAELEQFIFGDSGNRIEFGAQQCRSFAAVSQAFAEMLLGILVRDDAARERLKKRVGDVGLIM